MMEKFWERVLPEPNSGCWLWIGAMGGAHYGVISINPGQRIAAHRYSLQLHGVDIPDHLFVLHRCDTPLCVNPNHLFVGTYKDNAQDRDRKRRGINSRKTHCNYGHPLSGDNLYVYKTGKRGCRACNARQHRENDKTRRPRKHNSSLRMEQTT
jgi:hypothetical protein